MNDVYKLMMDAGSFLSEAAKVDTKLKEVDDLFEKIVGTTQTYNKQGHLIAQTFKGIATNGEQLTVSLKATANGFQLMGSEMSNTAKDAQPVAQALTQVTKATVASTQANQTFLISWQSLARGFAARGIYNTVSDITGAFRQGQADAIEYEKAIGRVLTLAQQSGSGFDDWSRSVKGLSNQFGTDAKDTAEAYYSALSNQIGETTDQIESYVRQTQKFALVTGSTAEQANNLFSSAINSFGLSATDTGALAAKFFKIIDLGRIKASDLSDTLGRTAVPAHALGVTLDELGASLTVLTRKGNTPADAQTQMLNLFNKLIKPTEAMTALLSSYGYETGQAAVASLGLSGVLSILNKELANGGWSKIGTEVNDVRGLRAAIGLLSDGLKSYTDDLSKIPQAQAEYDTALKKSLEVTGQKMAIQLNMAKNVFLEIGQRATALQVKVLEVFGDNNTGLANLVSTATRALVDLAGAAALGAVVFGLAKLVQVAANARAAIVALNLAVASSPLGAVAVAAAAVGAILLDIGLNAKTGAEKYASALATFQENSSKVLEDWNTQLSEFTEKTIATNDKMYQGLSQTVAGYRKLADSNYNDMQGLYGSFAEKLQASNELLESSAKKAIDATSNRISNFDSEIKQSARNIIDLQREINGLQFDQSISGLSTGKQSKALASKSGNTYAEAIAAAKRGDMEEARAKGKEAFEYTKQVVDLEKKRQARIKELSGKDLSGSKLDRSAEIAKLREQIALESKNANTRVLGAQTYDNAIASINEKQAALNKLEMELRSLQADDPKLDVERELIKAKQKEIELNETIAKQAKIKMKEEAATLFRQTLQLKNLEITDKKFDEINKVKKDNPIFQDSNEKLYGKRGVNAADVEASYSAIEQERLAQAEALGADADTLAAMAKDMATRKASLLIEVNAFIQRKTADEVMRELDHNKQLIDDQLKAEKDRASGATAKKFLYTNKAKSAGLGLPNYGPGRAGTSVDLRGVKDIFASGNTTPESIDKVRNAITSLNATVDPEVLNQLAFGLKNLLDARDAASTETSAKSKQDELTQAIKDGETATANLRTTAKEMGASFATGVNDSIVPINTLIGRINALQQAISDSKAAATNLLSNPDPVSRSPLTKASGGMIHGSDTIPALLAKGEYVVNARASRQFASQLNSMNTGMIKFNSGGSTSNTTTNVGGITINAGSGTDVRALGQALRKEIKRGTVRLQ